VAATGLPAKPYLRVDEVADHLRVSRRTVYLWVQIGKLPGVRVVGTVRIPSSALQVLIAQDPDATP